jgi:serine/threonine protein kinase
LNSLHAQKIVRRELSPDFIIFQPALNRVVMTEFELAKLHDGSPTVSTESWPSDEYRAPEASSSDVDIRVDIFSWSKITIELLLGRLPADGREFEALQKAKVAKPLSTLLLNCISVSRRLRPNNFDEIFDKLKPFLSKNSKVSP